LDPNAEEQIDTILYILQQLFQRIRNEDIYEIQFIKIKMFLVSLNHRNSAKGEREEERRRKIQLFLQRLENNVYYPLLQEDFYSQLENIYL
jgi:CCR4-NOT transcriptional regulation complex NOT5 subunit